MRDRFHVRETQRRLDQDLDPDAVRDFAGGLDLREQRVDQVHVGGDTDFGEEQHVEPVPRLLHHVHHVAVHVVRVDAVDTHGHGFSASLPIVLEQARDHVLAGLLLVGRGDGILEVEKHAVRLAVERLLEQRRLGAGDGELAPLQPRIGRLVPGETHARTAVRSDDLPGGAWVASAACGAPRRSGNGAAVLR